MKMYEQETWEKEYEELNAKGNPKIEKAFVLHEDEEEREDSFFKRIQKKFKK